MQILLYNLPRNVAKVVSSTDLCELKEFEKRLD